MHARRLIGLIAAGAALTLGAAGASAKDLIAIITPSHDNPFFKAEADASGLFKFQVQGDTTVQSKPGDTWVGVPYSDAQAVAMALRNGFEPRYRHGAGEQYFWLWFFKKPS